MLVEIKVDGVTRTYVGGYDSLHCNDWDELVREQLDDINYNKLNEISYADKGLAGESRTVGSVA